MYGYEIRNRLAAEGESVQLSYLYKALKEMSDEGLLHSRLKRGEHGPQTRLYCLTPKGKKELGAILEEATELIHDFYEEYVANLPPEFFSEKFHRMTIEVCSGRANVALAISQPLTHLHREVLEGICGRSGAKSTYLIKPAHVDVSAEFPDLIVLTGSFDDIPLRDHTLDAVAVVDIQDATNLRRCCREFRRVLRSGGVLWGCSPFMGLGGDRDPLEVGEYMKKLKYEWTGKSYPDKESIRKVLNETFDYVDVASMGFLTAFMSGLKPIKV